ncbi:hypothetical protein [Halorubellus litoreus]|uniref:Uncharacterized protein n=1 Tax=Halorubellus litoreus TaxID=755308 RepID=A0ABD5VKX8_9EURY
MDRRALLPGGVAIAGTLAIVIGVHTELLTMRPGTAGTIETGWGGSLNHEEELLAGLSVVATSSAFAAIRWRRAALLAQAVGGVVLFYALRAVVGYSFDPTLGIYTGLPVLDGTNGRVIFGAEPYLLVLGGLLLIVAGVLGFRGWPRAGDPDTVAENTRDHSLSESAET